VGVSKMVGGEGFRMTRGLHPKTHLFLERLCYSLIPAQKITGVRGNQAGISNPS